MQKTSINYSLGTMFHGSIHDLNEIECQLRNQTETGYILLDCGEEAELQYLQLYYNGFSLDTNNIDVLDDVSEIKSLIA